VINLNSKKKWIIITIIIVIVTNTLTYLGSGFIGSLIPNGNVTVSRSDYNEISKFEKLFLVKAELDQYYDGPIVDSVLVEGAIKGMTSALNDPYTVFMNKKEYDDFNATTQGNYSGVGLQVQADGDKIIVVDIFEDSPAKKAGILPKDVIEKVDGKVVTGKDLETAVTLMKGQEGTTVKLTLSREGKGTFDVNLVRAKINIVTVKGEMIDSQVGLITVSMFDENTAQNFKNKLTELQGKGMKVLILDLRSNPGGLLNECVDMVSNFVDKGKVIVSTVDKNNKSQKYYSTGGGAIGMPMVILTNEGTASASEIFAGAIRDYKLGTLVGKKTYGKGVVQTLLDTGDGTALKVTISKYYTPNGENINHTGIKPDVDVDYPDNLRALAYDRNTDPQFIKAMEIAKSKIK
jgi:carboxyl-terminal processing protease